MTPLWQNSGVMQRRGDHRTQTDCILPPGPPMEDGQGLGPV